MKLQVRPVLIIVCILFAITMDACYNYNSDCKYITPYKETSGICDNTVIHTFKDMPKGNNWLKLDSLQNGSKVNFFNNYNYTYQVVKADFNVLLDLYYTQMQKGNVCTECPTQIKLANRSCFYKIQNEVIITLKTNREATKKPTYNENDWPEFIEVSTINNGNLNHIPGTNNKENFYPNKLIPSLTLMGKTYSNVFYVYDSLSMNNSSNVKLVEAYYSSNFGLLKYSFSNGETWSIN